jgi:hypothetical protein
MNDRILYVTMKTVYGHTLYYPVCDLAKTFAAIAHSRTLTKETIDNIKSLGYTVEVKHEVTTL